MKSDFAKRIFTKKTFVIILIINDGLLIVVSRNLGVISDHLVWFRIFLQLFFSPISFLVFWRVVWKIFFKMWKEAKFFLTVSGSMWDYITCKSVGKLVNISLVLFRASRSFC